MASTKRPRRTRAFRFEINLLEAQFITRVLDADAALTAAIDEADDAIRGERGPARVVTTKVLVYATVLLRWIYPTVDLELVSIHKLLKLVPAEVLNDWCGRVVNRDITLRMVEHTVSRLAKARLGHTVGRAALRATAYSTQYGRTGSVCVDATSVACYAKIRFETGDDGKVRQHTVDPDATLGRFPPKNGQSAFLAHGFDVHLATSAPLRGEKNVPDIIENFNVQPLGQRFGAAGADLVVGNIRDGYPVTEVLADQGYTNKREFYRTMYDNQVEVVYNLPKPGKTATGKQREAKREIIQGGVFADNALYCPCAAHLTPGLPRHNPFASAEERQELSARYNERDTYRASKRAAGRNGGIRVECPARAGRVRCPLVSVSMRAPSTDKPTVSPPAEAGELCRAATVTVDAEHASRIQRHSYGTTKHHESYSRRTGVERANAKIHAQYGTLERGFIKCRSLEKVRLLMGLMLATTNLEIHEAWAELHSPRKQRIA